jgi:hypothetical protein
MKSYPIPANLSEHLPSNTTNHSLLSLIIALVALGTSAPAQTTVSPTNRYAYAANAGWIDWNLSPTTSANGVRVTDTFLAGYAYAANFGWINFGDGAPTNGSTYANTTATNCGVNLALNGTLTGYAYGANIGWIQFEQTQGQPKLNLLTGQFTGSAYSANLGWIPLDTTLSDLATTTLSRPDTDADGIPDPWERFYFPNLTTATAATDKDGDGSSEAAEYAAGTDPTDPSSKLKITAHTYDPGFTQATLTWTIVPTRNYRIEFDTDLIGLWTDSALGTFTPTPAATATRTITPGATIRRYFRAVAVQPLP